MFRTFETTLAGRPLVIETGKMDIVLYVTATQL